MFDWAPSEEAVEDEGKSKRGEGKVSPCEDKRRNRGEKLLHCVKEEMGRWKEEEDKRGRQRRRCL